MKQPVFNVMLLKVLAMAIREGVDSDEDKGACWGQVARLLATPKEVSWLCPPFITIISRPGMRFKSHSWHAAAWIAPELISTYSTSQSCCISPWHTFTQLGHTHYYTYFVLVVQYFLSYLPFWAFLESPSQLFATLHSYYCSSAIHPSWWVGGS